ncbi:MAG TPA: SDR family oxidoreductase [Dongiaceae bacterium]|nr:SDR family oxidoreductase [Dongiaceae bacterium]
MTAALSLAEQQPARFLAGRAAWVTGGATGIGQAIALALARAGADIAIGSLPDSVGIGAAYSTRPSESEMQKAKAEIEAAGARCFLSPFDLRSDNSVEGFHRAAVAALGPIAILVNAAGVCAQELMTEAGDETWSTVLDINLTGAYRTARRCLPAMLAAGWGRIVNIGSTASSIGFARHAAYCASKHGLLGLARCIALEGASQGVTCNTISPGTVDTGLTRIGSSHRVRQDGQGRDVDENLRMIAAGYPQKRLIERSEIAALALFLCREEARGITGEDIIVAGGAPW